MGRSSSDYIPDGKVSGTSSATEFRGRKWLDRMRFVHVDQGMELGGESCLEIVTCSFRFRPVYDADGPFQSGFVREFGILLVSADGDSMPFHAPDGTDLRSCLSYPVERYYPVGATPSSAARTVPV